MRFRSKTVAGYTVFAVAGTNTVSFGIDFKNADTKGLLGFSVQRTYADGSVHFLPGFKIFEEHQKDMKPGNVVSTETDPIQSFVWDDFTLAPGKNYTYTFIPVKGAPDALIRQKAIPINISTEPIFSSKKHDIYFNRGAASSQAYAREFDNTPPDKLVGKKKQDAFDWLTRDLESALIKFISQTKRGETLNGCFYEFTYQPVLTEFTKAIKRGVKVSLVIDCKNNQHTVKEKLIKSTPRVENLEAIKIAKIPMTSIIKREANKSVLQHNKFMVRLQGNMPIEVWTGSTNITESGIFGQTNVGHWVKDKNVAKIYQSYWELLSKDPGPKDGDPAPTKKKDKAAYIKDIMDIQKDLASVIPVGVTPIFSPRSSNAMLEEYFSLIDKAKRTGDITLAFGISADLKKLLEKHDPQSPVTFMVLEKEDKATKKNQKTFYSLNSKNNVYEAFGAFVDDPVYKWVLQESNAIKLGLGVNISYIHSKFLLQDALGNDPVIVTGSANFSANSTVGNDENMIVIRGDQRVADIYFTEFNRLFSHFYYRAVVKQIKEKKQDDDPKKGAFLDGTDAWLSDYKPGSLKTKRVVMYTNMANAKTI
jgi:phosphatidylserine/phosphatidylglycerophosphate/cardiolipin synthase-like enzyme